MSGLTGFNYRVLDTGDGCFSIIEVYYDGERINSWCNGTPLGETAEELREDLGLMLKALNAPILTPSDLPGYYGEADR